MKFLNGSIKLFIIFFWLQLFLGCNRHVSICVEKIDKESNLRKVDVDLLSKSLFSNNLDTGSNIVRWLNENHVSSERYLLIGNTRYELLKKENLLDLIKKEATKNGRIFFLLVLSDSGNHILFNFLSIKENKVCSFLKDLKRDTVDKKLLVGFPPERNPVDKIKLKVGKYKQSGLFVFKLVR